jgi:hypothetical protein
VTQAQLDSAVADATGESVRIVRHLGFGIVAREGGDLEPEDDLRLVVDCPFCRRPVPFPGRTRDGSLPVGECESCDVYFDHDLDEVYTARACAGRRSPGAT